MLTLWLAGVARASCDAPYPLDQVADDLGAIEVAVLADDPAAAERAAALRDGLPCVDGVLPRVVVGRAYRAIGAGLLVSEPEEARSWLRTAAVVDGGFLYSLEELPREDHPMFSEWESARASVASVDDGALDGQVWSSGTFYVDGRRMSWPLAEPGMVHIVQRSLEGRSSTWRVEGNAFPPELLVSDARSTPRTQAPTGIAPSQGKPVLEVSVVKQKNWPVERVVLVSAGSAALVTGGALYGLAWNQRQKFDATTTRSDADRLARSTNTLSVASGSALAAGAGVLGFGVLFFIVDGDPRPTLDLRF